MTQIRWPETGGYPLADVPLPAPPPRWHGDRLPCDVAGTPDVTNFPSNRFEFRSPCREFVDFRGLNPDAFDGRGKLHIGLSEQLVFPRAES